MADLLKLGVNWLATQMDNHMSEEVVVRNQITARPPAVTAPLPDATVKAVLPSCMSEITSNGVKIQSQHFDFIFSVAELTTAGCFPPERGLEVIYDGKIFEIAIERRALWYYLDPFHKRVVVKTIYKGAS